MLTKVMALEMAAFGGWRDHVRQGSPGLNWREL